MFINTKPASVEIGRSPVFQSVRAATVARGLNVSRGLPNIPQMFSPPVCPSAFADRLGAAIVFVLGVALVAAAMTMVAQIWANLGMIR
jgi:hypothetical protein